MKADGERPKAGHWYKREDGTVTRLRKLRKGWLISDDQHEYRTDLYGHWLCLGHPNGLDLVKQVSVPKKPKKPKGKPGFNSPQFHSDITGAIMGVFEKHGFQFDKMAGFDHRRGNGHVMVDYYDGLLVSFTVEHPCRRVTWDATHEKAR